MRRTRLQPLLLALLGGCMATESVEVVDPPAEPVTLPQCVEDTRVEVTDLSRPAEGFTRSAASLLTAVEGDWEGSGDGLDVSSRVALGDGPVFAVTSHLVDPAAGARADLATCPSRYELPVVQTLETDRHGLVAVAAGVWWALESEEVQLRTWAPLVEVAGVSPVGLTPSEWDTVDLELVTTTSAAGTTLVAQWSALRETDALTSAVATGTSDATVQVSAATELLWSVELVRD
jgi:hypothetical protein